MRIDPEPVAPYSLDAAMATTTKHQKPEPHLDPWTAPRLMILGVVTLGAFLAFIFYIAH
jgi:hypothetical protein